MGEVGVGVGARVRAGVEGFCEGLWRWLLRLESFGAEGGPVWARVGGKGGFGYSKCSGI